MYAVVTIVECFRTVLLPELEGYRLKELPGTAFNAWDLQFQVQEQPGWTQTVVLPCCDQGTIRVTEEQKGSFQALLGRPVSELLDLCWLHFLSCYNTSAQETPLLSCATPLSDRPATSDSMETGLCVPIRIMHPAGPSGVSQETRITVSLSNNLLAFLLELDLPERSALGRDSLLKWPA